MVAATAQALPLVASVQQIRGTPLIQPHHQLGQHSHRGERANYWPWGEIQQQPKLRFFLTQVWTYMQEYEQELPTNLAKVRIVTMALEGKVGERMVALHNEANELHNFNSLMAVL